MNFIFDDQTVKVEEFFELLDRMELAKNDKIPARNVFHRILRSKEKEEVSLQNSISITARNEGKLIGFMKLITDHSYMYYILDVMVDPKFRGIGIAREMMDLAIRYGKDNGFIKITLTSIPGKEDYYKSFGFREGMSTVLSIRGEDFYE